MFLYVACRLKFKLLFLATYENVFEQRKVVMMLIKKVISVQANRFSKRLYVSVQQTNRTHDTCQLSI